MKMTKAQTVVFSILFVIAIIICTVGMTVFGKNVQESYALSTTITNVSINNGADIVSIRATSSSTIIAYYVGTSNDINSATRYAANGATTMKISLLNGTYYFWVKDSSGTTAKYGKTVTITNSCSSDYLTNAKGSGTIKHCYYTSNGTYLEETKSEQLVTCASGYSRDESQTKVTQDTCSSLSSSTISAMGLTKKVCYKVWSYACVADNTSSSTSSTSTSSTSTTLSVLSATTSSDWSKSNKTITVTSQKGSSSIAGYYISTSSTAPTSSSNWQASSSTTWTTTQGAGTYYIWVKDSAGNISSNYKSVTVSKIDNTAPTLNSVVPSSANKTLIINATDSESGIGGYYVSQSSTTPTESSEWLTSTSTSYSVSQEAGTYYVWVKDAVGNISSSKKVTIASSSVNDNNSLASLSINDIEISPEFDANTTEYSATSNSSKITIDATLADSNASFVSNYGPRTVNLSTGENTVLVKVKSALGNVKEYKIVVTYGGKTSTTASAKLKSLTLNSGNLTFDSDITEYRMYVPNSLESLEIEAVAEDSNAEVTIDNPQTLEVGDNNITITVTATDGTQKVYSLRIIKKETEEISTNNYLSSLTITGYDIDFQSDIQTYAINLGSNTSLNVNAVAEDSNAEVTINDTTNLTEDSIISIMVRAEDGSARIYTITLDEKSYTVLKIVLIILGVLASLMLIAYVILKILGYSIYINLGAIKDFFLRLFGKNKE